MLPFSVPLGRVDRHRAFAQLHLEDLPVAQHLQASLYARVGGAKQVGEGGGAVRQRLRNRDEAAALVDGDDLVAALQACRRRGAAFEHVEHEGAIARVGA